MCNKLLLMFYAKCLFETFRAYTVQILLNVSMLKNFIYVKFLVWYFFYYYAYYTDFSIDLSPMA